MSADLSARPGGAIESAPPTADELAAWRAGIDALLRPGRRARDSAVATMPMTVHDVGRLLAEVRRLRDREAALTRAVERGEAALREIARRRVMTDALRNRSTCLAVDLARVLKDSAPAAQDDDAPPARRRA